MKNRKGLSFNAVEKASNGMILDAFFNHWLRDRDPQDKDRFPGAVQQNVKEVSIM